MKAEVVAVGSELLLGQIANTNARDISLALATVGVETLWHCAVGDDLSLMVPALRTALRRADVVVIGGGLGPTHDDLTREGLAEATGRALERRPELVAVLEERFRRLGRRMAPSNLRQADRPWGGESIPNTVGTAPGVFLEHEGTLVFALPGVPDELGAMLAAFVLPRLALSPSGGGEALVTRTIKTAGIPESDLADRIKGVLAEVGAAALVEGGPRLAILASEGEVRLCLTARGHAAEMAALEARLREILGPLVYGGASDTLEGVVSGLLRGQGLHLAVAESLTGGMLTSRLVGVPGASDLLLGGYVAYTPAAKIRDLGVPAATIERYGVVSEETARAMAAGARERCGADVAIATTGEAGPAPAEAMVGQVCVGLAWDGGSQAWTYQMGAGRELVRRRACTWALNRLRVWLLERAAASAGVAGA